MNLFDKLTAQMPFGKKSAQAEYFFALNIGLSEITAAVWAVYNTQLDILNQITLPYRDNKDLLDKAYQALDKSLGVLEIEPQKILFGVPDSWNLDDNLKEPYLKLLKQILKECDLQALAYVTTTNAISFMLQKQDGAPPTAILLGMGDFIEVTLVRGGRVADTRTASRSEHLFDDIEKTLRQFTEVEVLPSKILLYPTKQNEDLSKIRDEIMSYPWMSKLSFLHFPKIEVLDSNIGVQAVILAGASEMNPDVDLKHSFSTKRKANGEISRSFTKTLEEDNLVSPDEELFDDSPEEFNDNQKLPVKREVEATAKQPKIPLSLPLSFGDLKNKIHLPAVLPGKLLIAPAVLLVILAAYLLLTKAIVTVYVEPKILERETEVVADPTAKSFDEEKKIIPGKVVELTVSGSDKEEASGTKQIGDPAKGKVIVYNLTSSKVSFSQGTILTSASGLKFALDSSVQVASQSSSVGADFTTVIKPGKSDTVGITAAKIGPEGNLAAGSELTLSSYTRSQVVAKVEEALAGGTSKDVTVVTLDDQKKLKAKVLDELRVKAEEELKGKMTEGDKIIADALSVVDGKYTFSKQVNDQAKEFSLSANVRFKGTSYKETDLRTIVSKLVETNVPEGYEMNLQDAETQAEIAKVEKDGKLIFKARFRAKLLPKFNMDELKEQIKGKSADEVAQKLKSFEGVIGSQVLLMPNLPAPLSRLPWLDKNISISVTPK